jgi:dTDP-4-dehydrorhamnose 3,5-epimerase
MALQCEPTEIPDVLLFRVDRFKDARGFFMETFHADKYREHGVDLPFVQDNFSHSTQGTVRGLHYQLKFPQAKLVTVLRGAVYDVAVDIRKGSPTFGKSVARELSSENNCQLYIPAGFAHGFCVLSDEVDFIYKCSDVYHPEDDYGVLWNDPALGIEWPVKVPVLSDKDQRYAPLANVPAEHLPA